MWQFFIDRGGTFTDIVAVRPDGKLIIDKLLSDNPGQYTDAAIAGIRRMLGIEVDKPIAPGTIDLVRMGTTVATNALLERKGCPLLLVTSHGFADAWRIGYQNRPDIFDLNIRLPEQLYKMVVEVPERVSADGSVIIPLDEQVVAKTMVSAFDQGIRSVAIVFMHGYSFKEHEERAASIAKSIGFTQISTSCETSPLIKIISRGNTTIVDAYLSPILNHYVQQLTKDLNLSGGGCRLVQFMQSNGGLTDASLFRGKSAILSGPAGGVVGMVKTSLAVGLDKLIGFDMGGTSTDVCHYAGSYERSFETEVAGVRMRSPMMDIHTVAAGGGSILTVRNQRLQVGPDSAGSHPGPACYGRDGPLTVTDCNLILGKIHPSFFPCVFGDSGKEQLDRNLSRNMFAELSKKISEETGQPQLAIEEVANGFLRIAVDNMANAIKKISLQRGYDVTEYTLNCFGGAGGQHACLVADALGIKKIMVHSCAGVLSALGIGLADVSAMREQHFERDLDQSHKANAIFDRLDKQAIAELVDQGIKPREIRLVRKVYIRYKDSQQLFAVSFADINSMRSEFLKAYRERFGYVLEAGKLVVELLSSEATGNIYSYNHTTMFDNLSRDSNTLGIGRVSMYVSDKWQQVDLMDRRNLNMDEPVDGPAIIVDSTGTNVIESGWRAQVDQSANLIITRSHREPVGDARVRTNVDPVMLEVFNNLFMAIADQMGITLANTAHSVNIKERLDFSCAIFDAGGGLVANAPHVPVHLGSMSDSVRSIAETCKGDIESGDVFMMNNPFKGGTHLPDVTLITPVFDSTGKDILFFVASRGHHADIGGTTPGSSPPYSSNIHEEGIFIDAFKLVSRNKLQSQQTRSLLSSSPYPCRNIEQNMADLTAQIAANATGSRELISMIDHFGLQVVQSYMDHIKDNAEECVRQAIVKLKDGSFCYRLDKGLTIKVSVAVNHADRNVVIDFTGTSPQDTGNYNAPLAVCRSAVIYVLRTLVATDIPLNDGCLRPVTLIVPEGSILNPKYPAAVVAGNTEVSQAITDSLYGALGVMAGSQGTMNNLVYGNDSFQNYETICGGAGAGSSFNGTDAVHTHMTNTRMTDPEVLEERLPVRVDNFFIRKGSGGDGRFRGGDGAERWLRFLQPATVTLISSNRINNPHGMAGGKPGSKGENILIRADGSKECLQGNDSRQVCTDDIIIVKTPGGGGFGDA